MMRMEVFQSLDCTKCVAPRRIEGTTVGQIGILPHTDGRALQKDHAPLRVNLYKMQDGEVGAPAHRSDGRCLLRQLAA